MTHSRFNPYLEEHNGNIRYGYFNEARSLFYVEYNKDGTRRLLSPYGGVPDDELEGPNAPARVPFRLHELLRADRLTSVYLTETEEQSNLLAQAGFIAATCPQGLVWWNAGWGEKYFKNRPVIILTTPEQRARETAAIVANDLKKHVSGVAAVTPEGCENAADLLAWLRQPNLVSELERLSAVALTRADSVGISFIDPASWTDREPPDREWMWLEWLPLHQASLITGSGATGKSLLGQQLATCVALGLPCLGVPTRRANAIYITAEDDEAELHRRQASICDMLGTSMSKLSGKLWPSTWQGKLGNELAMFDRDGNLIETDRYRRLVADARQRGVSFIVLDNKAHLFGGNENDRHQVTAFVNLFNRLAIEIGGAVLFIAHPNKAGNEWSGSTAWEDQVRSRLFLEIPTDEKGYVTSQDKRVLKRGKANYARKGDNIEFHWHRWAFVRADNLPEGEGAMLAATLLAQEQDQRFLDCLDKATAERRSVSLHSSAPNYAPRVFQKMPTAKGMKARNFESALDRLLNAGTIAGDQPLWQRDNRAWVRGLGRARDAAPSPHEASPKAA